MSEPVQVNMHEAKTHLSRLVERVEAGEEIVLSRAGKPVARIVAVRPPSGSRTPGALRGRIRISDDFDAPLPDEMASAFAGERP
jgi:prevent-host-death family protein